MSDLNDAEESGRKLQLLAEMLTRFESVAPLPGVPAERRPSAAQRNRGGNLHPAVSESQKEAPLAAVMAATWSMWARRLHLWPWAALLVLCTAGGATLWVHRAWQPPPTTQTDVLPLRGAEAPAAPEQARAKLVAPTPRPNVPTVTLPTPVAQTSPGTSQPQLQAPAEERVLIRYRPTSPTAKAEADRLATQVRAFAARVDMHTARAIPRLPTIRYFHAEDGAKAQELAIALRRPGTEWRVQALLPPESRRPRGMFAISLPEP